MSGVAWTRTGASLAACRPAKSSFPVAPALEQVGYIELPLLPPQLFLLIRAALAGAQSIEDFALTVCLVVLLHCMLAIQFEPAEFGLEFLP